MTSLPLLEGPPCRGIWQEFLADDLARANWQVAMEATGLLAIMATLVAFEPFDNQAHEGVGVYKKRFLKKAVLLI
jgi:hypothetical protein